MTFSAKIKMRKTMTAMLMAVCLGTSWPALAQEGGVTVELNKLEPSEDGTCRAFFLFRNQMAQSFEGFELSIAVLDTNGVIDRLLSVDAAPLPVARTTLKLFEIPEIACDDISELIVHDMPVCKPENADSVDCFTFVEWVSRTKVRLGP